MPGRKRPFIFPMPGRKWQPRVCKDGWTDAHEPLIHLYAVFGLKSEAAALLDDTKLISDDDAFPPSLCFYTRDRTYSQMRKLEEGHRKSQSSIQR